MSDAQLLSDILTWLKSHPGHANARPRRELWDYLHAQGHSLPKDKTGDCRKLREIYGAIANCGSCGRGLFWIVTPEDRRIARGELAAPAASMFKREKRIGASPDAGQMELPL
jgi:hypothetical protein